jgi:AraC-like DNA-binding protein
MIIEKQDGTLAMYIRTRYGIGVSYSCDGGNNWSAPVNSWLGGPDSRFFIRRLKSGRLLLVNHYNFKGRNNLTAMLSEDDGETWKGYLLLDERANVSYPDAIEANDGYIYVTYDRERGAFLHRLNDALSKPREILIAKVTEEDILAGKIVSKGSELKVVVDKLTEYNGEDKDPYCEIVKDKDEYVRMLAKKETGNEIVDKLFEDYGRCCMSLSESSRQIVDENCELLLNNEKSSDVLSRVVAIEKIISVLGEEISEDYQYSAYVIERVKNIVNENVSTVGFSLNEVAEQLNVSKYYICHLFKNRVGITVLQYINHRRLSTAKLLLVNSDKSILAISIAVGFIDAAYFSKWFKRMEGITPMAYRNLNKIN